MPHLSPMNWIMSIAVFWTSMSLMISSFWWSNHHMFNSEMKQPHTSSTQMWKWLLQDGWE